MRKQNIQSTANMTPEMLAEADRHASISIMYAPLLQRRKSWIARWRAEQARRKQIDVKLQSLTDTTFLDRASIEQAQQRIANAQENLTIDGLEHMRKLSAAGLARPTAGIKIGGSAAQ